MMQGRGMRLADRCSIGTSAPHAPEARGPEQIVAHRRKGAPLHDA
jgi:hypothetical protein